MIEPIGIGVSLFACNVQDCLSSLNLAQPCVSFKTVLPFFLTSRAKAGVFLFTTKPASFKFWGVFAFDAKARKKLNIKN